jgi:hypothetical protein
MPRVADIYSRPPGIDAVPNATIESVDYNVNVADVEADLNLPRPIVAGGTGANSASAARDNLDAERAMATVTNYNTQVWENGSFWSDAGATGAPNGSGIFSGTVIVTNNDQNNIFLSARNVLDTATPPRLWVRQKNITWGTWKIEGEDQFVNVAGDTMTGQLIAANSIGAVSAVSPSGGILVQSSGAGNSAYIAFNRAGAAGGLFGLDLDNQFRIGGWSFGAVSWRVLHEGFGLIANANGSMRLGTGFEARNGTTGGPQAHVHNFSWSTAVEAWVNASFIGYLSVTSDYRTKKDVTDLLDMWDTVKALRPIKYTQAEYTPKSDKDAQSPMFVADDIERWGFIAHELQETLIESAATGVKDDPVAVQSPNSWTVIAALTKALQEAMTRIEALEAR